MQRYLFSTTSSLNLSLFCSHTPRQQERAKNSTSIRRAAVPMFFATSGCNPTWHWPPHLLVPTQLQSRKARTQHPFIAKQFQCILHSHSEEPHQIVNCAPHTQCRLFHASRFWWKPSPCYSHVRFFPTAFPWRPLEPQNLQTQPRLRTSFHLQTHMYTDFFPRSPTRIIPWCFHVTPWSVNFLANDLQ